MSKFERRLLSRATYEINFEAVLDAGLAQDMFFDDTSRSVFEFKKRFTEEYGRSPTAVVIRNEFPGFLIKDVEEPLDYLIDRIRRDYDLHRAYEYADQAADTLGEKDPDRFFEIMAEAAQARSMKRNGKTVNLATRLAAMKQLWMSRADTPDGLIGIDTGFETINNATLGFQASQLVTIAGLGGAGKSTLLMLMARKAQAQGKRPYFMSFEMGEDEQIARYMAMAINVPYNKLVGGRLKTEEWRRYDRVMEQVNEQSIFTLCTDITRSSTVPGLEAELRARDLPDVAFIDGVYMMRDHQTRMAGSDWAAMTNITRDLKQLAQRLEIPVVISTQALVSKTSKARGSSRRKLDMYSPGYSSSFAQDSDVMFGLEYDEGYPDERILRVTKARHCAPYTVRIEWNWRTASFGAEMEVIDGGEGDDDDDV